MAWWQVVYFSEGLERLWRSITTINVLGLGNTEVELYDLRSHSLPNVLNFEEDLVLHNL